MSGEQITPALSAEEWARIAHIHTTDTEDGDLVWEAVREAATYGDLRKTVALAMYGQPFGFTREDVIALKTTIAMAADAEDFRRSSFVMPAESAAPAPVLQRARALLEKIEALLPPK